MTTPKDLEEPSMPGGQVSIYPSLFFVDTKQPGIPWAMSPYCIGRSHIFNLAKQPYESLTFHGGRTAAWRS